VDRIDVPAHPLLVHRVVVLAVLVAVAAIAVIVLPWARQNLRWLVLAGAAAIVVLVPLTTGSGEALEERVTETEAVERHADTGETLLPWAIVLLVGTAGIVAVELPSIRDRGWLRAAAGVAAVVTVVGAVGTGVQTVRIVHSGAEATWGDLEA
jgi:hypothetical protein